MSLDSISRASQEAMLNKEKWLLYFRKSTSTVMKVWCETLSISNEFHRYDCNESAGYQ